MSASVNYRTDFKIFEVPAEGAEYTFSVPFRFSYYTTGATVFVASHCNGEYNNCELLEDGRLKVTFDNHGLAPGRVLCRREFYLTDEDYNDGICNAVFDTTTDIFLTLSGSDLGDITVELPPFYQKGDPFKWEDMTAEQREYFIEQVGADVVATNEAVIAAEAQRVIAENKRSERFESVMQEATTQAGYAKEQGDYAKAQGEYARNWAEIAVDSALQAQQATSNIEKTSQSIKEAEAQRVLAEQEREKSWNNLKSEANSSISETKASSSNANKAALSASTAATNANNAIEEMQQSFDGKVAEVDTQVSEKIAAADAATERANTAAGNADAAREAIQEDLGRKANTDGTYSKMTVGFAENVVGDGSATEEEFSFRPTAGVNRNTLNDGAARIHTLKGRSVVANQIAVPRVTPETTKSGITYSIAADGTIRVIGTASSRVNINPFTARQDISHKYMMKGAPNGSSDTFYLTNQDSRVKEYGDGIIYTPYEGGEKWWFVFYVMEGVSVDLTFKPILIDLTQEFGAGNEPMTVEEYYQRKPILLNEEEYNEGKLVNLVPKAIKTTGLNQFNGTYAKVLGGVQYYLGGNYTSVGFATEMGGAIEAITTPTSSEVAGGSAPADRLYTPTQNGYIYANGDSICISLYWPTEYGNLYGTYQPYKPFERDLSWVSKYFSNGMRSAGSAHDEIRFNSTKQRWEAVTRIGVVDLGDLQWTYGSTSKMFQATGINNAPGYYTILCPKYQTGLEDKQIRGHSSMNGYIYVKDSSYNGDVAAFKSAIKEVMANYELAEPIVTPITENINFDYDVSDYGTEELIVAEGVESAPLSASIEYSPNVLAVLKNAPDIADDVDMLKSQLAALTAQLAALTATNNE